VSTTSQTDSTSPAGNAGSAATPKTLVLVHGRGWKPDAESLASLWRRAMVRGLERDFPEAGGGALLDGVAVRLVYYGDLSNVVLAGTREQRDLELDLADREHAFDRLAQIGSAKKFRRAAYEELPGKSSLKEFIADVSAPLLAKLGLTGRTLRGRMPEVVTYLELGSEFRTGLQQRLLEPLVPALAAGHDVMLMTHCLGSVAAYDALWRLTHDPAVSVPAGGNRVHTWVTLGSPLADEFVKKSLEGAKKRVELRYPRSAINWYNVAAEDDFTCHDETMANDFKYMLDQRLLSEIRDFRIYNLTVRYSRSNPHSAIGYLIHPRVTRLLATWLGVKQEA
jgi:hypothetical protein